MKTIVRIFSILLISVVGFGQLDAQETDAATLKSLLQNKNFTFRAQSAWPLQGTVVQLTAGYDVKVLQDSLNTFLPYFGRAYTGGYTTENGIKFISKKFDYKLKEKQKGGWELSIRPTDTRDVTELTYSISTNGYATLQVISNNRQAISFYGVVEKK
ncbi:MAG TPA: DUF4251 domain-containing protein [Flavisolibacter sp.]|jgi:hypothetical protein|nr:DUF4251 domain-containing protein [Flavisolibacter sp.]